MPPRSSTMVRAATSAAGFASALADAAGSIGTLCRCLTEIEAHRTERARIEAETRAHIAQVQAFREVVLTFLARAYDERRAVLDAHFAALDRAFAAGDARLAETTLQGMGALTRQTPLHDLAAFRAALADPSTEFRF